MKALMLPACTSKAIFKNHQFGGTATAGPKPSELYGKFTWKIENFSEVNKRELRSTIFEVGSYKW